LTPAAAPQPAIRGTGVAASGGELDPETALDVLLPLLVAALLFSGRVPFVPAVGWGLFFGGAARCAVLAVQHADTLPGSWRDGLSRLGHSFVAVAEALAGGCGRKPLVLQFAAAWSICLPYQVFSQL
jgi:hypothetical protein